MTGKYEEVTNRLHSEAEKSCFYCCDHPSKRALRTAESIVTKALKRTMPDGGDYLREVLHKARMAVVD